MISLEWVKDYIDIGDQDLKELAVKITRAGINVEKVITNHIDYLVIGEVVSCQKHPDSDHLHVCLVDVGMESLQQIVCGAPNVRAGLKVIVALPGAVLPGNFVIKKSRIRGVESRGMLCALFELGLEEKTDENYAKGICELDSSALVGEDPISYLGLDDTLYELDVHKHRNNDCYYHIGFAYEIAAILNRRVTLPKIEYHEIDDDIRDYFSLTVETEKCPYYLAKMVTDVKIGESPDFIKRRLVAAGMRSINNVVDISNYVMLEFGQPMHFFDKDKLGNHILVRDALAEEVIVTLDGVTRKLTADDIVITDGKSPVCVAGVMGGENTEVDGDTKNILIESAIFDAVSIRNTASRLNLRSEASIRYGKGLNYEYTLMAMERACSLLEKYAGAKVLKGMVSHDVQKKEERKVSFVPEDINRMLGIVIREEDMKVELERLGFPYEIHDGTFEVVIPNRRLDIDNNVNDIAEEIGRLYGYSNLVSTLPSGTIRRGKYAPDVFLRKVISKRLRGLGLNEVKTYTLTSLEMASMFRYQNKENFVLPNPMSVDKSVIRNTILPSIYQDYLYNKQRKVEDICLYEISKVYDNEYVEDTKIAGLLKGNYLGSSLVKTTPVDFYVVKGIVFNLLDYLGLKGRYSIEEAKLPDMHPYVGARILLDRKEIGIIGKVHPNITLDDVYMFELSMSGLNVNTKPLRYKESNKYPKVVKDMAFVVDEHILAGEMMEVIRKNGGRLLTGIDVFDVYVGKGIDEGKKSIAFSLTFEDYNRTLTDIEVNGLFNKIIEAVVGKFKAELRDN